MKKIISLIDRILNRKHEEIQEAPRFEEWFNKMYPRDVFNPEMEEFSNTILQFKKDQKSKLTQKDGHSQSF